MLNARSRYARRKAFSASLPSDGSPTGAVIDLPTRMRLTPIILETSGTAVIWTTGIPDFSISAAIVAPQRVLDPQVEVRMTAPISVFFISHAISAPICAQRLATVAFPEVEKNRG